jgi:hypothetical protein
MGRTRRARLERLEQALKDSAQRTVTVTSRTCPCCQDTRILQRGEVITIIPRKAQTREDWAALVAQSAERLEAWKHHHYHKENRYG